MMWRKTIEGQRAFFAGLMYWLCMMASIVGGTLLDNSVILDGRMDSFTMIMGTCLEVINALGVIGIAAVFWSFFKETMPALSVGYLVFRSIEGGVCLLVSFIPLFVWQIGKYALGGDEILQLAPIILQIRTFFWDYIYVVLFVTGAFLFYSMAFRTRIIPRYLALWGLISLIGVALAMLYPGLRYVFGLLIIVNELYLGTYLMLKGVRVSDDSLAYPKSELEHI